MSITVKNLKTVIKLLDDYDTKCVTQTPVEFLDELMKHEEIPQKVSEIFLIVKKHEKILDCLVEYLGKQLEMKNEDMPIIKLAIYLLLFELKHTNYEEIRKVFTKLKMSHSISILNNATKEEWVVLLLEISSSVFCIEYVLTTITQPFINRQNLLEKLQVDVSAYFGEKTQKPIKPVTKPVTPNFVSRPKPSPPSPKTPPPIHKFKTKPVPPTTYKPDSTTLNKIKDTQTANKIAASNLLKTANEEAFRVTKLVKKPHVPQPKLSKVSLKASKVPKFNKEVEVKNNAAVLMRQAALFVKTQEKEIKKLEALSSGAFDDSVFELWEEEERQKIQQENLQNIERKHLEGLLTYEEALIAKQNLIKNNKKKMEEFRAEQEGWMRKLEEWKMMEQEKIKGVVEKAKEIEGAAREAEKKAQEEKYMNARIVESETRKLLEEAMADQQTELNRKIELIKQLKMMESFKELYKKEFDPTETSNLGLMCEMSIAELQERLAMLKVELKEELEEKKKNVTEMRQQRKDLLDSAQEFINHNRTVQQRCRSAKKSKKCPVQLKETPEIVALKDRICELRKLRVNAF